MPVCKRLKVTNTYICAGDKSQQIKLINRQIMPPALGDINPQTIFTTILEPYALVQTIETGSGGTRRFDGINVEDKPTHDVFIDFDSTIWPLDSDNVFVRLEDGRRLRIVAVANINEQNLTIAISATERGVEVFAGSEA